MDVDLELNLKASKSNTHLGSYDDVQLDIDIGRMTLAALGICTGSIYSAFLIWGLLQERLTTTPYTSATSAAPPEFFKSPLFINAVQAALSSVLAGLYLLFRRPSGDKRALGNVLGLHLLTPAGAEAARKDGKKATVAGTKDGEKNGSSKSISNGREHAQGKSSLSPVLVRYLLIAALQSTGSQLGFLSLRHISYPTMILGKSCKLVPVLIMNLVLYRRKIAGYKYAVVALVTLGISIFMLFGHEGGTAEAAATAAGQAVKKVKKAKKHATPASSSLLGLFLLTANLLLDGATNSTQDEIFTHYTLSGPQMMLAMNAFSVVLLTASLLVPDPHAILASIPILGGLVGSSGVKAAVVATATNELGTALAFIHRHPQVLRDIMAYAIAGASGQIAIFETLERFGSLTLVSITVTRKLFTMLLSVVVYKHSLSPFQWIGVLVVFAGIGIEAREKRREGLAKRVANGSAKAKVKDA